jgi:hypothetical protein
MRTLMLAGAIILGLATSPAHADTTTTFSRVKTVNADAESVVGCVTTDIFLSSFDSNSDAGKGSQVYLEIFKQNSCTDKTLDHIVGFVVLRPSAFTEKSNATSAKLTATVPTQNNEGKVYNARVQVTWTANGPPTFTVDKFRSVGPNGTFIEITKGKASPATTDGTIRFAGSTYVVKTEDAGISKSSDVTITRTQPKPQS